MLPVALNPVQRGLFGAIVLNELAARSTGQERSQAGAWERGHLHFPQYLSPFSPKTPEFLLHLIHMGRRRQTPHAHQVKEIFYMRVRPGRLELKFRLKTQVH